MSTQCTWQKDCQGMWVLFGGWVLHKSRPSSSVYVDNEEGLKERIKKKEKAKEKGTKEHAAFLAIQEWISVDPLLPVLCFENQKLLQNCTSLPKLGEPAMLTLHCRFFALKTRNWFGMWSNRQWWQLSLPVCVSNRQWLDGHISLPVQAKSRRW